MMEAFGGKGFFIEDPKDLKAALEEAMEFNGPALVNVRISQESAASRKSSAGTADPLRLTQGAAPQGAAPFARSQPEQRFRSTRSPSRASARADPATGRWPDLLRDGSLLT